MDRKELDVVDVRAFRADYERSYLSKSGVYKGRTPTKMQLRLRQVWYRLYVDNYDYYIVVNGEELAVSLITLVAWLSELLSNNGKEIKFKQGER